MKTVEYTGAPRAKLWNGRWCKNGDQIEVSDEQATELLAPGPDGKPVRPWKAVTKASAPKTVKE